jgi:hypothetical protein
MTNLVNTQDIARKFSDSFVLVRLQLSRFGTNKIDKDKSAEFRNAHNVTSPNAAKVTKELLPKSPAIKALKSHDDATWNRLKRFGAPYSKGVVMLPATKFLEATTQLRKDLSDRDPLIKAVGEDYAMSILAAQNTLGTTFNPKDYPSLPDFLSEFSHEMDVLPVADPSQLNVVALGDAAEAIQHAVNETYREKIESLSPYVRSVLLTSLNVLSDTCQRILSKDKTKVFDSSFQNVHAAAEQAKHLNISDDEQIRNAVFQIEQTIPTHSEGIKEDKPRAAMLLSDVNAIIESLDGTPPVAEVSPCDPATQQPEPSFEDYLDKKCGYTHTEDEAQPEAQPPTDTDSKLASLGWI